MDVDFVRKSVRAIGRCAIKVETSAERCVSTLLDLIQTKVNYVVQVIDDKSFGITFFGLSLKYNEFSKSEHSNSESIRISNILKFRFWMFSFLDHLKMELKIFWCRTSNAIWTLTFQNPNKIATILSKAIKNGMPFHIRTPIINLLELLWCTEWIWLMYKSVFLVMRNCPVVRFRSWSDLWD